MLRLRTRRLSLVAATPELARAELEDLPFFAGLLAAEIPTDWPPPLNDEQTLQWTLDFLEQHPDGVGWGPWYLLRERSTEPPLAIGTAEFKGLPSADGTVEIGYSVLEAHQRRGFATEAVGGLVGWALSDVVVRQIVAQTLPGLQGSIRVLEKCGFERAGAGKEDAAILFRLRRAPAADTDRSRPD